MFRLRRPSDADLANLAASLANVAPTWSLEDDPKAAGLHHAAWSRRLRPGTTLDDARTAINGWAAHTSARVRVRPLQPPTVGLTVVSDIALGPVHALAPCRVVEVIDEPHRCGFTYATLPGHPECGVESFVVTEEGDGTLLFDVAADSRPADVLTRLGAPVSRRIQAVVSRRYLLLGGLG